MKLSKTKRDHSLVFNMTPMIDIVFLLIIFFMTVSQITRVVDQPMQLPNVDIGASKSIATTVTINVDKNGKLIVSSKPFTLDHVLGTLQNMLSNSNQDLSRVKIEIRCDRRCPAEHVNRLVKGLSKIGFTNVRVAVSGDQ